MRIHLEVTVERANETTALRHGYPDARAGLVRSGDVAFCGFVREDSGPPVAYGVIPPNCCVVCAEMSGL